MRKECERNKKYDGPIKSFVAKHFLICVVMATIVLLFLRIMTEDSLTLLPICIHWNPIYAIVIVFTASATLTLIKIYVLKSFKTYAPTLSMNFLILADIYLAKVVSLYVIIPALIFLPNRYIPVERHKTCYGLIVGTDYMSSKGRRYYSAKVKLNGEKTCFWYRTGDEPKPIGTKCILSVGRGIFGLRYVQNVDFIVE